MTPIDKLSRAGPGICWGKMEHLAEDMVESYKIFWMIRLLNARARVLDPRGVERHADGSAEFTDTFLLEFRPLFHQEWLTYAELKFQQKPGGGFRARCALYETDFSFVEHFKKQLAGVVNIFIGHDPGLEFCEGDEAQLFGAMAA